MKLRLLVVSCCALFALTVGATTAGAGDGGNSDAAKACQQGGWKNFVDADGSGFKNQGDCVAYAALGNTLVPKTQSQLDCESFGAVYSTDPADDLSGIINLPPPGRFIWSCNGVRLTNSQFTTLFADCVADTNGLYVFGNANQSSNYSCFKF